MMDRETIDANKSDPRYDSRYQSQPAAGKLGMIVFLLAIGMLFAAALVAYVVIRARAPEWPPPGTPPLFYGIWISTAILVTSSIFIHLAYTAAKNDRQDQLKRGMLVTTLLAVSFLLCQLWNWSHMSNAALTASSNMFGFAFYMLTGLHGLHVLGGVFQLVYVTVRSFRGAYSSGFYPGVLYSAMYWHFLTALWIVVFSLLVLGS